MRTHWTLWEVAKPVCSPSARQVCGWNNVMEKHRNKEPSTRWKKECECYRSRTILSCSSCWAEKIRDTHLLVCVRNSRSKIMSVLITHRSGAFARATFLPKCCVCRYTHRPMDIPALALLLWRLRQKRRRPLQRLPVRIAILGVDRYLSQNKLMLTELRCSARKNNETIVSVPAGQFRCSFWLRFISVPACVIV
jgi:hypothetical protein